MRYDIFPTPFWHIEGAPQQLIDELYQGAYSTKEKYPSENRSNEGGYQSPNIAWEEFHPQGKEYIYKAVGESFDEHLRNKHLNRYHPTESFSVQSWWYNISGKGHWNTPHTHPGSDFALVLYLTDSDGLLRLMSPHYMRMEENSKWINVNAKKGDIVIFPADLIHYVMPNTKETDRVCISMNLQLC